MPHYRKQAALELIVQLKAYLGTDRLQPKDYMPKPEVNWNKILEVFAEYEAKTKNLYQHKNIFSLEVYSFFYQYILAILIAKKYLDLKDANTIHKHSAERRVLLNEHVHFIIERLTPYQKNHEGLKDLVLPPSSAEPQKAIDYEANTATKLYKDYVQAYNKTSSYKLDSKIPDYFKWEDVISDLERAELTMLYNLHSKQPDKETGYRYIQVLAGAEKYLERAKKDNPHRTALVHEHLTFVIETLQLMQAKVPALIPLAIPPQMMASKGESSPASEKPKPYRNEKLTPVLKKIENYATYLKNDPRSHSFFGTNLRVSNKGQMLLDFVTDIQNATDLNEIKKLISDFDLQRNNYIHHKAIFSLGQNATTLYFNSFMSNIGCATRLRTTTITLIDELRELVNESNLMPQRSTRNTIN